MAINITARGQTVIPAPILVVPGQLHTLLRNRRKPIKPKLSTLLRAEPPLPLPPE